MENSCRDKILKYFEILSGINYSGITKLQKSIFLALFLISIFSFFISMHDIFQYGGVDLRNKVVGSRAFWQGINPYRIEWSPPTDDWLLDPARRYPGPSRATVTPLVLAFYGILAWLPYKIQRIGWALLEWASMLASIFILNKTIRFPRSKYIFLCISVLFFVSSYFWRLHIERGQYYIFLTLFLSIGIYLDLMHKGTKFAGIPFGLAAMFRPTYCLLLPFFFIFKKYRTVTVMLMTVTLCFILTSAIDGILPWFTYVDNVKKIEEALINKNILIQQYGPLNETSAMAEGVNVLSVMNSKTYNETFVGILIMLKDRLGIDIPFNWSFSNKIVSIIIIISSIIFGYFYSKQNIGNRFVLLFSLVMIINLDFFVPERYSYADVLFLPVICLIISYVTFSVLPLCTLLLIILAFTCNQFIGTLDGAPGSLLRYVLFIGSLNVILIWSMMKKIIFNKKKL